MIFPPPRSLSVIGVADPGVPNSERLVLRPTETVNLASYGVMLGLRLASGNALPLYDNFFWFGEIVVAPPSWILLYTRPGTYETTQHTIDETVHNFFWNRSQTVFSFVDLVPIVFEIGSLAIGNQLRPAPRLLSGSTGSAAATKQPTARPDAPAAKTIAELLAELGKRK